MAFECLDTSFPRILGPTEQLVSIALYRALLTQCAHIPIPGSFDRGPVNPLKHLIRKCFRRNRHDTSPKFVTAALKSGYEAESVLHEAATGSQHALDTILSHLDSIQARGDASRLLAASKASDQPVSAPRRPQPAPYSDTPNTIALRPRPLSEIKGKKRTIPTLVSVMNVIPILRFKRPQPDCLSRVIKDKVKAKTRHHTILQNVEQLYKQASVEDAWDGFVERLLEEKTQLDGRDSNDRLVTNEDEPSWTEAISEMERHSGDMLWRMQRKNKELAKAFKVIVDKETALAEEERIERVRVKNRQKRERREAKGKEATEQLKESV